MVESRPHRSYCDEFCVISGIDLWKFVWKVLSAEKYIVCCDVVLHNDP